MRKSIKESAENAALVLANQGYDAFLKWIEQNIGKHQSKNPAAVALGSIKSPKKAESSRKNGKLGGRPKKPK